MSVPTSPILELRVALTSDDYKSLLKFYTEGLGLEPAALWTSDQGHAVLFELGKATVELFDQAHADSVDRIEVGRRVSGPVRFALQVPDLDAAVERLVSHGALLLHPPVTTPWGDRNARLQDPDGLQITLFQTPPGPPTPAEENKTILLKYIDEVWHKNNPAAVDEFLAPDYRRYTSPTAEPLTLAGQKQRLAGFRAAFPDIHLEIADVLAEGDRVVLRSTIRGTHLGAFQGIPPTGHRVYVSLLDAFRFKDGKIVEHWGGPDLLDLVQQLGAVVTTGPSRE